MAFMVPEYTERRAWHIDGPGGLQFFFASLGKRVDALEGDALATWLEESGPGCFADILDEEESNVWSVERDDSPKWYARLSAPGYMDATDWSGPYETESEARAYLESTYDVDAETGETLDDEA